MPCSFSDITVPVGAAVAGEGCNGGSVPVESGSQCNITKDDYDCQNVQCLEGSWDKTSPNCTLATLKTGVVLNLKAVSDAKPWLKMTVTNGLTLAASKAVGQSNKFVLTKANGASGQEISNGDVVALYSEKSGSFVEITGTSLVTKGTAGDVSSWPTEPAKHFVVETTPPDPARAVIYSDTVFLSSVSTNKYLGRPQEDATQCAVDDIADKYLCQALATVQSGTPLTVAADSNAKPCEEQCGATATCDMYTKTLDNSGTETSCSLYAQDGSIQQSGASSGTFGCMKVKSSGLPTTCAAGVQKDNADVCAITLDAATNASMTLKCCNGIWERDTCLVEGVNTNMRAISGFKSIYNQLRLSVDETSEREYASDITEGSFEASMDDVLAELDT